MPRVLVLALVSLLVAPLAVVECVSCRECGTFECSRLDPPCKHGQTMGICHCCPMCAKGPGEVCGGMWNLGGRCGEGLYCVPPAESGGSRNVRGTCKTGDV